MTHDYERYGTATLFAALSVLDGLLCDEKTVLWTAYILRATAKQLEPTDSRPPRAITRASQSKY